MNKNKCLISGIAMLVASISVPALGYSQDFSSQGIQFAVIGESEVAICGAEQDALNVDNLMLPAKVTNDGKEYVVTSVADEAFLIDNDKVTYVDLPANVKSIGKSAFAGLKNLEGVYFPKTLMSIGEEAFSGTGLKVVSFYDTLTEIGDAAFMNCPIETAKLSHGLTQLGKKLFYGSRLKSVEIPQSVKVIGEECFKNSYLLSEIGTLRGSLDVKSDAFANTAVGKLAYSTAGLSIDNFAWPDGEIGVVDAKGVAREITGSTEWASNSLVMLPQEYVSAYETAKSPLIDNKAKIEIKAEVNDEEFLIAPVGVAGNSNWLDWYPVHMLYAPKDVQLKVNLSYIVAGFGYASITDNYIVKINGSEVEAPSNHMLSLQIGDAPKYEIEVIDGELASVSSIDTSNASVGEIFTLSGVCVANGNVDEAISSLEKGVYIVKRAGSKPVKIIK